MKPGDRVVLAGTTGPEGTVLSIELHGLVRVGWGETGRFREMVRANLLQLVVGRVEADVPVVLVETMALTGADVSGDRGDDPAAIVARAGGLLAYCRRLREEVAELRSTYDEALDEVGRPSLHAEALAACGVPGPAMSDRELAVLLLRAVTSGDYRGGMSRWGHLAGVVHNGSAVRYHLLCAAGINPDEETGWDGEGECPTCGSGGEE